MAITFVKGGLKLTPSAVIAGQKGSSVSVDPQLIAVSTPGKFTITPAISRALNLKPGDYIGFVDTLDKLTNMIAARHEDIVALANASGVDLDDAVQVEEFIKAYRQIGIYKAVPQKNSDGSVKTGTARISKEEKAAYAAEHRDEIIAALTEAGVEITEENILGAVNGEPETLYNGSKLATTGSLTGVGLPLNFTDTNYWNNLKADIEPDSRKVTKRIFDVDIKNPQTTIVEDGYKGVEVTYFLLKTVDDEGNVAYKDETVTPRGKGEASEVSEETAE